MSTVIALNCRNSTQDLALRPESVEEKALAFFQRAEQSETQPSFNGRRYSDDSTIRLPISEVSALAFFQRTELSDTLQSIWNSIKYLPFSTVLKLLKMIALVLAVILLSHSISLTGLLALAGTVTGLLLAAISNVLVWFIYVPIYFVRTPDFTSSVVLAIGLAWLGGVSPFFALVFSPVILFGSRLLEHSQWAQQSVSQIFRSVSGILDPGDIAVNIRKATADISGFIGYYLP